MPGQTSARHPPAVRLERVVLLLFGCLHPTAFLPVFSVSVHKVPSGGGAVYSLGLLSYRKPGHNVVPSPLGTGPQGSWWLGTGSFRENGLEGAPRTLGFQQVFRGLVYVRRSRTAIFMLPCVRGPRSHAVDALRAWTFPTEETGSGPRAEGPEHPVKGTAARTPVLQGTQSAAATGDSTPPHVGARALCTRLTADRGTAQAACLPWLSSPKAMVNPQVSLRIV